MDKLVARLESWPNLSGVKHLKGNLAGKHRLRTGDYRMQFRVEQTKRLIKANRSVKGRVVVVEEEVVEYRVIVEKVGHRDGFYEE